MTDRPFVSVVVPVYNDPEGIRRCLKALTAQTYPENSYEVIVVDNGSTDETPDVIGGFDVELAHEREIQGSYAARNRGLEVAAGDVIAFTDADCVPRDDWIANGVSRLGETDGDLAGGHVSFTFSAEPTSAERFDARANMRNDKGVSEGYAKTANLFVRASVVEEIGAFPEQLQSGGDVYWTRSATRSGFTLVYAADAVVEHPARGFLELLKKQYRVGKGHVDLWRVEGRSPVFVLFSGLIGYPRKVVEFLTDSGTEDESDGDDGSNGGSDDGGPTPGIVVVAVACVLVMNLGRVVALVAGGRTS